ncbi:hypothetical protein BN863_14980, partial [Formosa agariphila KMM 3901]
VQYINLCNYYWHISSRKEIGRVSVHFIGVDKEYFNINVCLEF